MNTYIAVIEFLFFFCSLINRHNSSCSLGYLVAITLRVNTAERDMELTRMLVVLYAR